MQLMSMTGFGKAEYLDDKYQISVEIKSVNNRHRDFRFKMGNIYNAHELEFRKLMSSTLKRGSFDIFISYKKLSLLGAFEELDPEKIKKFTDGFKKLFEKENINITINPTDFLRSDFNKDKIDSADTAELIEATKKTIIEATHQLELSRQDEGLKIQNVLIDHRNTYEKFFKQVAPYAKEFKKQIEERLQEKFLEYKDKMPVDEPRFAQEIIYYLEKLDIQEEINRIAFHLEKFDKILENDNEKGRELEFLAQELGRETNTIGSKSNIKDISELVIQMKVQLEKIREQSLNVE